MDNTDKIGQNAQNWSKIKMDKIKKLDKWTKIDDFDKLLMMKNIIGL